MSDEQPQEEPRLAFREIALPEEVQRGIEAAGFTHGTPIQSRILPLALAGRDVAGQAQTGTGKTAAFLISIFTRLWHNAVPRKPGRPRALVIAPTRELAIQIAADARVLGQSTDFVIQVVYGGVDYKKQRESLREDVDLLVGTPGRLIDYLKQDVYHLEGIEVVVIDEADRMFDLGFIRDLRFLLRRCPPPTRRQSMLFSATLSHDVMELAYVFLNDAVRVEVQPEQVVAERVEHRLYHVGNHEKMGALLGVLAREGCERTLIFANMRRTADYLQRTLSINGYSAEQITGDIEQRRRLQILDDFREGRVSILVATDVASRGLHIDGVTHVLNYDLPLDPEDYVHRVGRTARAGASGTAISFACENYVDGLEGIEAYVGFKLPSSFPEDDLIADYKWPPRRPDDRRGRLGGGRPGGGGGPGDRRSGRPGERGGFSGEGRPRPSAAPERRPAPERAPIASPTGPPAEHVPSGTSARPEGAATGEARKRKRRRKRKTASAASGASSATDGGAGGAGPAGDPA